MPLSQVMAYNTEHLIDASTHWDALADQREEVFATVQNEARRVKSRDVVYEVVV